MSILHLLRNPDDTRALETARAHAREHEVTLILLQDAVYLGPVSGVRTLACAADRAARPAAPACEEVDYDGIVRLIASHDRVISW